jgi:hypothetical protein
MWRNIALSFLTVAVFFTFVWFGLGPTVEFMSHWSGGEK